MNFEEYVGKNIKIVCTDGQIIKGPCCGYELLIDDDELQDDVIEIRISQHGIMDVKLCEIKTIEIID